MDIYPSKRIYNMPAQQNKRFLPIEFITSITAYIQLRIRQLTIFSYAAFLFNIEIFTDAKAWSVRRMFWGRSSFYRSAFHTVVSLVTVVAVITGITTRLNQFSANSEGLDLNEGILGRTDIFSQAGTADPLSSYSADAKDYAEYKYVVQQGDSIAKIAGLYGINDSTIRWANDLKNDTLRVGQVLRIPEIDGVFIAVKEGDTLQSLAAKYKGVPEDIIDLNTNVIDPRDPKIAAGMELFIPNGIIITPTARPRAVVRRPVTNTGGQTTIEPGGGGVDVPPGTFVHPLGTDPNCAGWSYSRGYRSYHKGVDLAKRGDCWINSVASGTVELAGWWGNGAANTVIINHGNGFVSHYYHGNGVFAVQKGDKVKAGQKIMKMGCTGNCTGQHLHMGLHYNNQMVDPERYIRIR